MNEALPAGGAFFYFGKTDQVKTEKPHLFEEGLKQISLNILGQFGCEFHSF